MKEKTIEEKYKSLSYMYQQLLDIIIDGRKYDEV